MNGKERMLKIKTHWMAGYLLWTTNGGDKHSSCSANYKYDLNMTTDQEKFS